MKKLHAIRDILRRHAFELDALCNYGFAHTGRIWVHKGKRIVVKYPFLCNDYKPRKDVVPTLTIPSRTYGANRGYFRPRIHIQPFLKPERRHMAADILREKHPSLYDIRAPNVGWYRRKPVMHDW